MSAELEAMTIGAYEAVYALKSGGMGDVLIGRRRGPGGFDRVVAIKTIRAELASAGPVRAMFLDEAGILARLSHPGVAVVHDFGEENGTLYLVMEYVAGISFRDLLDLPPAQRMPPLIAARALADAARGLHAAHELQDLAGNRLGVVHRDISPDNLMLDYDGNVKVIDFGIALINNTQTRQSPVTEFGMLKGKPPYMSPEQLRNDPLNHQSDVFSLAAVAHEMLTGEPLFSGTSIYQIARAVELDPIDPPSKLAGELPPGLDGALLHALTRELSSRTASALEFATELERVIDAEGGASLPAWAKEHLSTEREAHRAWLGSILAGSSVLPKRGRSTGGHTQLGPGAAGVAPPELAPAPGPLSDVQPVAVANNTNVFDAELPARSNRRWLIVLLALLALGAITAVLFVTRSHQPPVVAVAPALIPVTFDAAPAPPDASVVVDAALQPVPLDAHVVVPVVHAVHRTELVTQPAVAAPPQPVGSGTLRATATPFATIRIDGHDEGSTPNFHLRVAAGHHVIELVDPENGTIRTSSNVVVVDGQSISITAQPKP